MNPRITKNLNAMSKANLLYSHVKVLGRKLKSNDSLLLHDSNDRVFPIEAGLKDSLEYAFEADFSNVKIHIGEEADRLTSEHGAKAITIGSDIFFGGGKYEPFSEEGQKLLVHELQHVLQSQNGQPMVYVEDISDLETDAERIEELIVDQSLENMEKGVLNDQSRYQRTNTSAGGNDSLLRKAEGGSSSGSFEDMLEADQKVQIEYRLSTGEVVILTEDQYREIIKLSKETFKESLEEKQYFMTTEQYELEVHKTLSYLKGDIL